MCLACPAESTTARPGVPRAPWWQRQALAVAALALAATVLTACGGGGGAAGGAGSDGAPSAPAQPSDAASAAAAATAAAARALAAGDTELSSALTAAAQRVPTDRPANDAEAARFLTQATFGPTPADIEAVRLLGYGAWIDYQFRVPSASHRAYWEAADAALKANDATATAGLDPVLESFWKQALTGRDQLRQRLAFALSEVFVISAVDSSVAEQPRGVAHWLDLLGSQGTGTYRNLLESVSLNPLMGLYLTSLRNQKADAATGRVPDENYAREVMQLFSIGLVQLNADGTPVQRNGQAVETYTPADISGLAKVFTGWSWACGNTSNACFTRGSNGTATDPDRAIKPMKAYPAFHATEAKTFLGVTIPAQSTADPAASLKVALDTLAAHPNTGPFISRQLIQRFVTSNPSPAYVKAVAAVFADNGQGVRGDLQAVVKALLTHPEARSVSLTGKAKLREPVLRLSAYLRAFPHTSDTGAWKVGNTDSPATALGQTVLRAPSVFNFFRPGYVAPGSRTAAAGLGAPELQLFNESTASAWVNYMRDNLSSGVGVYNGTVQGTTFNRRDLQRDWSAEIALADQPSALVTHLADKLYFGQASTTLTSAATTAVGKITVPAATATNAATVTAAKRTRVNAALLLLLAAPEFHVQP